MLFACRNLLLIAKKCLSSFEDEITVEDMRESYMIHEIVHSKDQIFLSDGWTAGSAIAQRHVNSF